MKTEEEIKKRKKDQIILDQILKGNSLNQRELSGMIDWDLWEQEEIIDLIMNFPEKTSMRLYMLENNVLYFDEKYSSVVLAFFALTCDATFDIIISDSSAKRIPESIIVALFLARSVYFDAHSYELLKNTKHILKNCNLSKENKILFEEYKRKYAAIEAKNAIIYPRYTSGNSGGIH